MTSEPGDQTRGDSTPYIGGSQAVTLSRNEVSALCMKAARGAGMDWGMAEEAGFAAGWLTERGFDGPKYLLGHLTEAQGRPWSDLCPSLVAGEWRAPPGRSLCPIALGATLCDHVGLPEGPSVGCSMSIGPIDHPILLIPFLFVIEGASDIVFDLLWTSYAAGESRAGLIEAAPMLTGQRCLSLRLIGQGGKAVPTPLAPVPEIAADTIAGLNLLAMRTTVPASDASRAGAGSTTNDND